MSVKIKIKNFLWQILILNLVVYSVLKYRGMQWKRVSYANVVEMFPKVIPTFVVLSFVLVLFVGCFQLKKKNNFNNIIGKCALILFLIGLIEFIFNFEQGYTLLFHQGNPLLLIEIAFTFIIVNDESIAKIMRKLCGPLACLYTGLALLEVIKYLDKYASVRMAGGPIITYFANALFLTVAWWCIISKENKRKLGIYVCCGILMIVGVITTSRGWILQIVFLTCICYFYSSKKSATKKMIHLITAGIGILVIFYLIINYAGDTWRYVLTRVGEDTRSGQLSTFFEQVSIFKLITGSGYNASYIWNGIEYKFIDNQILFWMFRYGIMSVLAYWLPFFYGIFKNVFYKKWKCFIPYYTAVVMWVTAMLGLCIYYSIFFDIGNIFIIFTVCELIKEKRNV